MENVNEINKDYRPQTQLHETLLTGQFSENERRRGRHSGIDSQHDEGLTDPQLHGETERQCKIVTN